MEKTPNPTVTSKMETIFSKFQIGIPRTPEVFLQAALEVGHPKNLPKRVSPELERAINFMVGDRTKALEELRGNFLKKWLKRAIALKDEDNTLKERMPEHLRLIMKGKRLLLWKEIRTDLRYPDVAIIDEAINGFSLTGWGNRSGVFESDVRAPGMSIDHLKGVAMGLNSAVVSSLKSQEWTDLDERALQGCRTGSGQGLAAALCGCKLQRTLHLQQKEKFV